MVHYHMLYSNVCAWQRHLVDPRCRCKLGCSSNTDGGESGKLLWFYPLRERTQ